MLFIECFILVSLELVRQLDLMIAADPFQLKQSALCYFTLKIPMHISLYLHRILAQGLFPTPGNNCTLLSHLQLQDLNTRARMHHLTCAPLLQFLQKRHMCLWTGSSSRAVQFQETWTTASTVTYTGYMQLPVLLLKVSLYYEDNKTMHCSQKSKSGILICP